AYGEVLAPGYHRFPELEVIANIPEDELRSAGFGYRGRTIPLVARQVAGEGGDLWFERCRSGGYDVAFGELLRLPGVGPKLADCICLYGFHFTEAVPLDTHMWQAACRIYFPELAGKAPTEARYRMIGEFVRTRFGSLAGYAQQLLFVDNLKNWRARPRYAGA
ncbi:MAG TPA: hypothetical protein VEX38_10830, partial [Fimbriimonadaceae bacterium]|nr:hypothetical protein [Fimbriimonadaceae bacterium]